jgi:predicted dehydrogenase
VSSTAPLTIGQIGISHAHAVGKVQVLSASPDVDFVGVFEPSARWREAKGGLPALSNVRWRNEADLLDDPAVGGIFVETTSVDNLHWAKKALEAGKPVLIDKAPGVDLGELRDLLELARAKNLYVQLGYNFRFNTAFEFALDAVRTGLLGQVFNIQTQIPTTIGGYEDRRWEVERYTGGIFFELACHMLDTVVAMLGTPERVTSFLRADNRSGDRKPYVDNTMGVLEYAQAMAIVQVWGMEVQPFPNRRFEIYGTKGSVRIEPLEPVTGVHLCLAEASGPYQAGWQCVELADRPRYVGDVEEFVAVVRDGREPRYGPEHDLAVQTTLLRATGAIPQ